MVVVTGIMLSVFIANAQEGRANRKDKNPTPQNDSLINSTTYAFSASSGVALEDMSSGTTRLLSYIEDNASSILTDIGFNFRFDGDNFTNFSANANGVMTVGQIWTGEGSVNQINTGTQPKIAPYWDQLCVGSNGNVHYKTVGSPGSRKLIVEWKNMKITRGTGCFNEGSGIFQVWLFEQTGIIQFVYGAGMTQVTTAGGYSVGIHKGASTNFASVTTATSSVSYTTPDNSQTSAISAGTSYIFTPPTAAAPTGASFSNITRYTMRVSWTDNASNETAYEVRRSTDGVRYTFAGSYPAGTTFIDDTGLIPGTEYFYKINAVTDGAFSTDLDASATTSPYGVVNSVAAGGLWSNPATWVGGVLPGAGDHVTIVGGSTVVIDTDTTIGKLTVGEPANLAKVENAKPEGSSPATLMFSETTLTNVAVADDITVVAGSSFLTGGGTITEHLLSVGGDVINNGTFDLSTNLGATGAILNFVGFENAVLTGSGLVTDVSAIRINKIPSATMELNATNFTAGDLATDNARSGYLTLTSGIFKIGGTFTGTHRTFAGTSDYTISEHAAFWLNNPNYTVAGQETSAIFFGSLRVSVGTYNIGLTPPGNFVPDQSLQLREGSRTLLEGGNLNVAHSLKEVDTTRLLATSFFQTGGTATVCTRGSSFDPCLALRQSNRPTVAQISGGKIVLQNGARFHCFRCFTSDTPIVQFGNEFSEQQYIFRSLGDIPNVVVDTTTGGHFLHLTDDNGATTIGTMNIGLGGLVDLENQPVTITGESIVVNGWLAGNRPSTNLIIKGANTVFSGTGSTLGFLTTLELRGQNFTHSAGGEFRLKNLRLVSGNLIGADGLTMQTTDFNPTTITIGDPSGILTPGTIDAAPIFELGVGGQAVRYIKTGTARTTGPEINPTRQLSALEFSPTLQTDTLTIAGGELTVRDLTLTAGRVVATGANGVLHSGTLSGANGYIYGSFTRKFENQNSFTYPIGLNSRLGPTFTPTSLHVSPTYVMVGTANGWMPGLTPSTSLAQNWTISVNGDIGGRFTFPWTNSEVNGNESNYKLWQAVGSGQPQIILFSLDAGANTISMTTDTSAFNGTWGVGEELDPGVSISGTVANADGMPLRNAAIRVTGGNLTTPIFVYTGNFGTYIVPGLLMSQTYTVTVGAKRYRFNPSSVEVTTTGNMTGINFTANPQE